MPLQRGGRAVQEPGGGARGGADVRDGEGQGEPAHVRRRQGGESMIIVIIV